MPIYMDYHFFDHITVEKVKQAHMIDKKTQDKYNVKYHQFWVNEKAGAVFCLIEGPNPEVCEQVHREAHGNVACNIVQVESGMIDVFMGKQHNINDGVVYYKDGNIDSGFRFILILDIIVKTELLDSSDIKKFMFPNIPKKKALDIIKSFRGKDTKNLRDDSIIAVFNDAEEALKCAVEIQNFFSENIFKGNWNLEFRIGLNEGQPVTKENGFFEAAIDYAKHLSLMTENGEIFLSKNFIHLSNFDTICKNNSAIKIINQRQEKFIEQFFQYTEKNLASENFNINNLSRDIGVSRPQLYRKITGLTGRSPGNFIRDIKMYKALILLKQKNLNISQVALEVGYNSPSYFSKCFSDKYGISPSQLV